MRLLELLSNVAPDGKLNDSTGFWNIPCPYHNDHNPSFGVSLRTGYGKCFSCGASVALPDLLMKLLGIPTKMAALRAARSIVLDVPGEVAAKPKPAAVKLLETSGPDFWLGRGLTLGDVHRFEFDTGWVEDGKGIRRPVATMPIFDRKHRLQGTCSRRTDADVPKHFRYLYSAGMAKSECLWGVHLVEPPVDQLFLAEGIIKAAVMRSQGYEALAALGSRVSKVQHRMASQHADEIVWVVDNDPSGVEAADFHASTYGYSIAIVDCDDCKDVDEQYVKHGRVNLAIVTARSWLRGK